MAEQGTEEQTSDQPSSEEASGRHRAPDEGATEQSTSAEGDTESVSSEAKAEKSAPAEGKTEKAAPSEAKTEKAAPSDAKTEKAAPSEAKTEKAAPSEAKTEQVAAPEAKTEQRRGGADTSWAEPEAPHRRHVDVGEIAWRAGNVLATIVRTLAFLFALVLIVNVVLVLVGVNPANGVAQFIGGLADRVILGFRDLFVPADPTIALIVNSLVAAAFWVFVGELLSRVIRFLAARVK